jgi:putative endonuclease
MNKQPAVYILTNKYKGTLYTGVTSNLIQRIWQHKSKLVEGFTKKYSVDRLVYFELTEDIGSAITREKQIKAGSRAKKISLIESVNPEWCDLYLGLCR